MPCVYILISEAHDKFYTGFTTGDVDLRIERHNTDYYQNKFTAQYKPWKLFWKLDCASDKQALLIEKHIKKMKSKTYIHNLVKYPEISQKLLLKFQD